jgi:hypothetical protein
MIMCAKNVKNEIKSQKILKYKKLNIFKLLEQRFIDL